MSERITDSLDQLIQRLRQAGGGSDMDPGGYIPAWIANIVLKDVPYFTLLKLRRIVFEPQYQAFHTGTFRQPW